MVLPRASLSSLRCLTRGAAIASVGRSTNSTATSSTRALSIVSHYNHHKNESVTPSTAPLPSSFSVLTSGMSLLSLQKPPPVASSSSIISHRPFSSQQQQYQPPEPITILTLSNLTDNPGAITRARRIGRGIGSSKGKTSGRGHKGQKARAGKGVHPTFEGGQTKFYKRMPKIGKMKNANFKLQLIPLNIGRVQEYVTMGRLIAERSDGVLTMRDFVKAGMFPASAVKSGVKLLGGGKGFVKDELFLEVPWASASAIEAVEKAGGYVTTVHHNRLALRALLKPHKFPAKPEAAVGGEGDAAASSSKGEVDVEDMHLLPKRARPPPKFMQYYTDYSKRGYLNPRVQLERKQRGLKEVH